MKIKFLTGPVSGLKALEQRANELSKEVDVVNIMSAIESSYCILTVVYKERKLTEKKVSKTKKKSS